jgi:hypothetical protein
VGKKDSIVLLDVNAFEPTVIPCRATANGMNILLWHTFVPNNNNNNTVDTINNFNINNNTNNVTINNNITRNNNNNNNNKPFKVTAYDPKVGYTLEQVTRDIALTCSATRGNTTENILYVLSVQITQTADSRC